MDASHQGQGPEETWSRERIAEYLDATTGLPGRADLIFIPGTRLPDPAPIAAQLLSKKVAPMVLVTGGINQATGANEADALRRELLSFGVPPAAILVENQSTAGGGFLGVGGHDADSDQHAGERRTRLGGSSQPVCGSAPHERDCGLQMDALTPSADEAEGPPPG